MLSLVSPRDSWHKDYGILAMKIFSMIENGLLMESLLNDWSKFFSVMIEMRRM